MYRNLVLIHLESLSNFVYKMNPSFFTTIREIESQSVSFEKYFSTATSTLMTLADIYYGGLLQYEQCDSLAYIPKTYPYGASLFDDLKEKGYHTGLYVYPDGNDRDTAEARHIAGFYNEMVLKEDYTQYLAAIDEVVGEEPFALSLCNYISNLAYNRYTDSTDFMTGRACWEEGFRALDKSVADIFDILKEKNVLGNTTVILYGDHGDDYWIHMEQGRTHPVEPYTHLVHTPLIIYDNRLSPGTCSKLISSIDIRSMLQTLLYQEDTNGYVPDRTTAISRIVYAAQPVFNRAMRKSYSITDGNVQLLVSNDGLEMYDIEMDPLCTNNLLHPFSYKDEVLYLREVKKNACYYQYVTLMNNKQLRYIRQKLYYMKSLLYSEVKELYFAANLTENQMNEEMKFDRIRYINNLIDDE